MSHGFDADSLARRYAFLDDCPSHLIERIVTFPGGELSERVAGVKRWRDSLLAGQLPDAGTWPGEPLATSTLAALSELGLPRFCRDQPELVDALLVDVIDAFAHHDVVLHTEVTERLRELETLECIRREKEESDRALDEKRETARVELDEDLLRRLRAKAEREIASRPRGADAGLVASWGDRARAWAEIADVFGDLGQMLGRGWDLSVGVLRQQGWLDLLRLRDLVARLPRLREIVRSLGRLHVSDHEDSVVDRVFVPVRRLEEERREVRTPLVPAEARGVVRSGEISRMLPAEAALLGHPKLRLLWHARRAERALLTYRVEGVVIETTWVEREAQEEVQRQTPRPERGPIIAVVDTSGSMHGAPEAVAKALVLEALRTAHAEKRRCFVYSYSGPGQVKEHELDLSPEGIVRLLAFLSMSFGGGNDESGMLARVVARLRERDWRKADVVFVSDGEWPAPTALARDVASARAEGVRFHGVQIGNRGRTGLHAVCDPVHEFRDWVSVGG